MRQFIAGVICGIAVLFSAMHFHLVRDKSGLSLVPKVENNLNDIYVDVRKFDLEKWQQHKMLAVAIMRRSSQQATADPQVAGPVQPSIRQEFKGMMDDLLATNP